MEVVDGVWKSWVCVKVWVVYRKRRCYGNNLPSNVTSRDSSFHSPSSIWSCSRSESRGWCVEVMGGGGGGGWKFGVVYGSRCLCVEVVGGVWKS